MHSHRKGRWAVLAAALFSCLAASQDKLPLCAGCHGADGNSVTPGVPSLAGQPRVYMENQLVLVRDGLRGTPVMQQALKGVNDAEIVALSKHFSALKPRPEQGTVDKALQARGAAAAKGLRCGSCHLPNFAGREQMPRLAGQREDYLLATMKEYRDKPRPGGDTVMTDALRGVPDAALAALAHFLSRSR